MSAFPAPLRIFGHIDMLPELLHKTGIEFRIALIRVFQIKRINRMCIEGEGWGGMYFKELVHMAVEAVKSKICRLEIRERADV